MRSTAGTATSAVIRLSPPRSVLSPRPVLSPPPGATTINTWRSRRVRVDCTGQGIIEDGYCNVCGYAPQAAAGRVGVRRFGVRTATGARPPSGRRRRSVDRPLRTPTRSEQPRARESPTGRTGGSGGFGGGTRGTLGAGLVEMPSVPRRDPRSVLLENPEVPERKRFCARCGMRSAAAAKVDPVARRASAPRTGRRSPSRRSSGKATWSRVNTAWPDASRTVGSAGSIWPRT